MLMIEKVNRAIFLTFKEIDFMFLYL